jgi:hypothetical protein
MVEGVDIHLTTQQNMKTSFHIDSAEQLATFTETIRKANQVVTKLLHDDT